MVLVPIYQTRNLATEVDPGARTILPGTNVTFSVDPLTGVITINASGGGGGTVTSVGASGSTGLTVGGVNPVTTSGVITFTLSANLQSWSGITPASKADLASPLFTGDPRGPTPATADNDTSLATTAFVKNQGYATTAALGAYVLKVGDTMSGPLIVNSTVDVTGNFTGANVFGSMFRSTAANAVLASGPGSTGTTGAVFIRPDGSVSTLGQLLVTTTNIAWDGNTLYHTGNFNPALKADLASPTFTGDPKAPTPATADNDTSIATTAFVKNQGYITAAALTPYALDSGVVHIAGTETITGAKSFSLPLTLAAASKVQANAALLGANRVMVDFVNTDTSTSSSVTLQGQSGSGAPQTINFSAPEYTAVSTWTGRMALENADNGLVYSARNAAGDHIWQTGVARNTVMTLSNAGALTTVGNVNAPAFVGAGFVSSALATLAGVGINFNSNGLFGGTLASIDTLGNISDFRGNVREVPQNIQNANYQFVLADSGKHVMKNNTTAYAYTIPANATTAFPIGTAITIINDGTANNITVTRAAGVALMRGTVDSNIAMVPGEMITILKIGTNRWKTP